MVPAMPRNTQMIDSSSFRSPRRHLNKSSLATPFLVGAACRREGIGHATCDMNVFECTCKKRISQASCESSMCDALDRWKSWMLVGSSCSARGEGTWSNARAGAGHQQTLPQSVVLQRHLATPFNCWLWILAGAAENFTRVATAQPTSGRAVMHQHAAVQQAKCGRRILSRRQGQHVQQPAQQNLGWCTWEQGQAAENFHGAWNSFRRHSEQTNCAKPADDERMSSNPV
jgi:hypothetical protein